MSPWKFLLCGALSATFAVKAGVTAAEFAPIDKAVEREHVAKQLAFVSRVSAHGADGEWLVIVHWR